MPNICCGDLAVETWSRKMGIEGLHEFYPSGAAGGDDRQASPVFDGSDHLRAFFQDGEVGAEVRVKDRVELHPSQGRMQLARNDGARRHAEFFAELGPDGGGLLDDDVLVGIVEGVPYLFGMALLVKGANRAEDGALPAVDAGAVAQALVAGRC